MEKNAESVLVTQAQNDPSQFTPLYEAYVDKIFRYFLMRTTDPLLSEDLTSETFVKALRGIQQYKSDKAPFGAWLFRIAHNALIDYWRTQKREVTVEEFPDIDAEQSVPDEVHQVLLAKEIHKILKDFSDDEREVLLLKLSSGLKFREIGDVLGVSADTAKTRYFRALKKLKVKAEHLQGLILFLNMIAPFSS